MSVMLPLDEIPKTEKSGKGSPHHRQHWIPSEINKRYSVDKSCLIYNSIYWVSMVFARIKGLSSPLALSLTTILFLNFFIFLRLITLLAMRVTLHSSQLVCICDLSGIEVVTERRAFWEKSTRSMVFLLLEDSFSFVYTFPSSKQRSLFTDHVKSVRTHWRMQGVKEDVMLVVQVADGGKGTLSCQGLLLCNLLNQTDNNPSSTCPRSTNTSWSC